MRQPLAAQIASALIFAAGAYAHAQGTPSVAVEAAGDAVIFMGQINAQSAQEFLQSVRDPKIKRLVITSRGGSVSAALDMAAAIHERGLDVEVPSACWSSCANYIFPAGRRKTLGHRSAVAWHGNMTHVLYLQQTGQGQWNDEQMESARQLARREAEFFRRIGVDGFVCWFAKIAPYGVEDFYDLSAADMARFGIRDVSVSTSSEHPRSAEVRNVPVDWAALEAARPSVPLR